MTFDQALHICRAAGMPWMSADERYEAGYDRADRLGREGVISTVAVGQVQDQLAADHEASTRQPGEFETFPA